MLADLPVLEVCPQTTCIFAATVDRGKKAPSPMPSDFRLTTAETRQFACSWLAHCRLRSGQGRGVDR